MKDPKEEQKFTRGLYRGVRISIRQLDYIIAAGVVVIAALLIFGLKTSGYTVTYDSRGGSDVESQPYEYGDVIEFPEKPTREGYVFECWALDENGAYPVDDTYEISQSVTLYAQWNPKTD